MTKQTLEEIAEAMVASGKGILAADESTGTIKKRFDSINVESTFENRRDYREMLFSAKAAMKKNISGVILFDETIRQRTANDKQSLVELMMSSGSIPGIKVDAGAQDLAGYPDEKITEGLDGLRGRLKEYYKLGARFAKWRAVITIGEHMPTYNCIHANAHALARYAALCQENGIVPIVEPEVLMDGPHSGHDIEQCYEVTEAVLKETFQELYLAGVMLEGMVLKPNMVIPGQKSGKKAKPEEVADLTVQCLKSCVPSAVPGIAFLSGGQSDIEATEHLSLMNSRHDLPWNLTFSYGRALQAAALKAWGGKKENVKKAQAAFVHRAAMNGLASKGKWTKAAEKGK
jgi:fructose-bisphosphate aldolase class I